MRPLIGIPQCLDARGRWRPGRTYQYGDVDYARAVTLAGGTPIHLSVASDPVDAAAHLDGLLLPGGDDLPPPPDYPAQVAFDLAPDDQIAFDLALLAAATERELPVFGVCYGMQLLALAADATLIYDIAHERPSAGPHQLEGDARHTVTLEPATRLAALLSQSRIDVNSRHHQAIARVGPELHVSARAADGVIEAVEAPGDVFRIGVQWHPEAMDAAHRDALFRGFVAACATPAA